MQGLCQIFALLGRVCLGLGFMGLALHHVSMWDTGLEFIRKSSLGALLGAQHLPVYLVIAIVIEAICGALLTVGYHTKFAASLLSILVLISLFFLHRFWELSGDSLMFDFHAFINDAMHVGGLFLILAFGPGRYSIDRG